MNCCQKSPKEWRDICLVTKIYLAFSVNNDRYIGLQQTQEPYVQLQP